MTKLARIKKKTKTPYWLHVKLPKIITAKEISGLKEVKKVGRSTGIFTGPAMPSLRMENNEALSSKIRKGLIHNDPQLQSEVQSSLADEKIIQTNWGENIFIDKEKIKDTMRYYVGGELAEKSQINDLLIDFQYLINRYAGYGFPSILSLWYDENEREWGYHETDNSRKKIEPDALLNKIFSVLAIYRLSFTVLERHQSFDKTVVIGMLSLLEPLLFVKKSLANNEKFRQQLERVNFYLNAFYKIAILNKTPEDCPKQFLSLVASIMHLMDNLDFSSLPKSVMKKSDSDIIKFLDKMEVPFRSLDQVDLINFCLKKSKQKNISAKNYKDPKTPGAKILKEEAHKLELFANELIYHRKFMNYNVKRASLWIYDYIVKNITSEDDETDQCPGGSCNMPGAVIEINPDEFSTDGATSDLEKSDIENTLNDGSGGTLQGKFHSFGESADFDYLDPEMAKAISNFIDSMKKDTGDMSYRKLSTSRVVDSGLDLNEKYRRPNSSDPNKRAGNNPSEFTLSEIDLKKFYEKHKTEITFMKNTLSKLCNRYVVRGDKEGEINRSRIMRLIYDTLNGDESNNYKKNKKQGIFAHVTIIRDVSGSTHSIQEKITNTCLKFAMAADLVEGIFVRVIDFQSDAEVRKEFKEFVPSKMQIESGGGTLFYTALDIMETDPDEMLGTHLHLVCTMSDFEFYDNSAVKLARTMHKIAGYSKHMAVLNVAFDKNDVRESQTFTNIVSSEGVKNVSSEVITEDRDIAQILSELVHNKLLAIIRGRV